MEYADSLVAKADWLGARLAYERVVYQTQDPTERNWALLGKARTFKAVNRYAEAQRTVERANAFVGPDSLRYLLKYEAALTAYLAGNYQAARTHAQQVRFLMATTPYRWQTFHLELLALHAEQRWAEAKALLNEFGGECGLGLDAEALYGELPKLKNQDTAEWLHLFMPGSGQWYAGYFWQGATSATINLAAITFALYHFWQGYYLLGAFTGAALFYAFYSGGYRHTGTLVQQRNAKITEEYNQQVNAQLLDAVAEKQKNLLR
ncbi:MAG TPA: hypothetical protein DCE41_10235 [Cytophagales bacterium]|nr:hypothetical protein [Cytophagales bacterium]HAA19349.1 hypothetical protein [Cytophagales bacterium]